MALFLHKVLEELPKVTVTGVHRLAKQSTDLQVGKRFKTLSPVTFSTTKVSVAKLPIRPDKDVYSRL